MSGSTRRSGGAGASLKGLFVDGVWHCDCNPRQPANHFEVKKQGPNQGKWFRTCQKQQNDKSRCKFFLWDGDAHPREAAALANNSRTEPSHADPRTPSKRHASPAAPYRSPESKESSKKRSRAISDVLDLYDSGANDESLKNEVDEIMAAVQTPRKVAKMNELATPSTRRTLPWNKLEHTAVSSFGLQTPQTSHIAQADPFSSRLGNSLLTPTRPIEAARQTATPSSSPYETPTPSRFKDVGVDDLVNDVFALLQDDRTKLDATTENCLKALLSRHMKAAEGLKRGRDVTRSTIKARDAKITELSYRIGTLEAELEAEKAVVKHLQWKIETRDHDNS